MNFESGESTMGQRENPGIPQALRVLSGSRRNSLPDRYPGENIPVDCHLQTWKEGFRGEMRSLGGGYTTEY